MLNSIYLILLLPYIPLWGYCYLSGSRRLRKEMLVMSILSGLVNPIATYLWWTKDWWQPPSIIHGVSAPEDILFGFLFGGICAVVYESFFKKKLVNTEVPHQKGFIFFVVFTLVACAFLFSFIKFNSPTAIVIAMFLTALGLLSVRKDLIRSSLYSGVLTLLISLPFYLVAYFLSPEWSAVTYKFGTLSGITVYGFPIEEFIFWFFYGLSIGPAYEYAKGWGFK